METTIKKPIIGTEEYPKGLREPMTQAEEEAKKKIQQQLGPINKKVIEYVKYRLNPKKSVNSDLLPIDLFYLDIYDKNPQGINNDYSLLGVMGLGIAYQIKNIRTAMNKKAVYKSIKIVQDVLKKDSSTSRTLGWVSPNGDFLGASIGQTHADLIPNGDMTAYFKDTNSARIYASANEVDVVFRGTLTQSQFNYIRSLAEGKPIVVDILPGDFPLSAGTQSLDFTSFNTFADYISQNKLIQEYTAPKKEKMLDAYIKFPDIEKLLGINLGVTPSDQVLLSIIRDRQNGIAKILKQTTLKKIDEILNDGISNGYSFDKIVENITKGLGMDETRAEVIARTETNWALNEGQRQYAKSLGVTQFEVSTADDACKECQSVFMNKTYDISQEDVLPLHPNCRCFEYSVIPDEWFSDLEKSAKIEIAELMKIHQDKEEKRIIKHSIDEVREKLESVSKTFRMAKDGKTPIKGVDYFTEQELWEIKKTVTPIKGIDYPSKKELEKVEKMLNKVKLDISEENVKTLIQNALKQIQVIAPKPRFGDVFGTVEENKTLVDYISTHGGSGGASKFTDLTDVPNTYTGQAGKFLQVKVTEDGLQMVASSSSVAWGAITGTLSDQTDLNIILSGKLPIAGGTMTGELDMSNSIKLLQIGVNATSYATQKPSNLISFETSNWNGATELKGNFTLQSVPDVAANRSNFTLKYGSTYFLEVDSFNSQFITYGKLLRQAYANNSTIAMPGVGGYLTGIDAINTDSTVNNYSTFRFINANYTLGGMIALKHIVHSATVPEGQLEFYIANGAAATNVWTLLKDGTLKAIQIGASATGYADQKPSNILSLESSAWTGSVEIKDTGTIQMIVGDTTSRRNRMAFTVKGLLMMTLDPLSGIDTYFYFRSMRSGASTTDLTPGLILQNQNSTVGNRIGTIYRNQGAMDTGFFGIKNVSHSATVGASNFEWWLANGAAATQLMTLLASGSLGIGVSSPTAYLHIKAGTAAASTAPIKLETGTLLATPEAGTIEFDGSSFYLTV